MILRSGTALLTGSAVYLWAVSVYLNTVERGPQALSHHRPQRPAPMVHGCALRRNNLTLRGAFVGAADDFEAQFGPGLGERDVAEFIENDLFQG